MQVNSNNKNSSRHRIQNSVHLKSSAAVVLFNNIDKDLEKNK